MMLFVVVVVLLIVASLIETQNKEQHSAFFHQLQPALTVQRYEN
jgi:hypothetical protein